MICATAAFIGMLFGCGCSNCCKERRIYKGIAEYGIGKLSVPQTETVFDWLIGDVKRGKKDAIDKCFFMHTVFREAYKAELLEDFDVALLHALGDEPYLQALKKQPREIQGSAASSLIRYQWNVDDEDQFVQALSLREAQYPKTKEYVFRLSRPVRLKNDRK